MTHLRSHLLFLGLTLIVCCVAYPVVLWVIGRTAFADHARGSLVVLKGSDGVDRVLGSRQIAQPFTADEYFWPRPSAASFNAAAAGGSNRGANNPKLRDRVVQQLEGMRVAEAVPVPADMVTTSGADLDPHITLRSALSVYQLDRVAAERQQSG